MSSPARGKKRGARALLACLLILLALGLALALYAGSYSRADAEAAAAMERARQGGGAYAFGDADAKIGVILYPGGKVESTAYAPLAEEIAETAGVLCAVPRMPLNLAVFDRDAASAVMAAYPAVTAWYVGGHSLGGAMAASYAAAHADTVSGVILLAAYATEKLDMPVLSVYGGADTVLNAEKYAACLANLPQGYAERVLPGGNHAQFGCYGAQKGDSPADIPAGEQRALTAACIAEWLSAATGQKER